jgi:hypothetical protein
MEEMEIMAISSFFRYWEMMGIIQQINRLSIAENFAQTYIYLHILLKFRTLNIVVWGI